MIYGYETPNLFPVRSLYDDGMMKMYADAVKSEYERGLADQKEFISKYGDFVTPFAADAEEWNKETIYKVQDALQAMQAQGVDPFRNREAQAMMGNVFRNINYGNLAKLKQSAETGKQYQKALAELAKEGKYNPWMEEEFGGLMEGHNTLKDGVWIKTSPYEYQGIKERTKDWFKQAKDRDYGLTDDGNYRKIGLDTNDARDIVVNSLPSYLATPEGNFEYNQVKKELTKINGEAPTDEEIKSKLADRILEANENNYGIRLEADPFRVAERGRSVVHTGGGSRGGSGNDNPSNLTPFQLAAYQAAYGYDANILDWAASGFDDKNKEMSKAILKNTADIKDFGTQYRGTQFPSDEIRKYISAGVDKYRIYTYSQLNADAYGGTRRYGNKLNSKRAESREDSSKLRNFLNSTYSDSSGKSHGYKMQYDGKLLSVPVWVNGKLQLKLYAEAHIEDDYGNRITSIDNNNEFSVLDGEKKSGEKAKLKYDGRFLVEIGAGVMGTDKDLNITESSVTYWGTNSK